VDIESSNLSRPTIMIFMSIKYHGQETCWTCGTASMRMVLGALGIRKSEKQLVRLLGTNKMRGTWFKDMSRVAEAYKLDYIVSRNSTLKDLADASKKYFVIVDHTPFGQKMDHYAVVRKVTPRKVFLYDPDPSFGAGHSYSRAQFMKIWRSGIEKERRCFIGIRGSRA